MKQRGFHRNKTSIAHFSRSLFGNLVANSDQLFLPIDIFPLQDLVLGVLNHCRGVTVREAVQIQPFPDNYFFWRTSHLSVRAGWECVLCSHHSWDFGTAIS